MLISPKRTIDNEKEKKKKMNKKTVRLDQYRGIIIPFVLV